MTVTSMAPPHKKIGWPVALLLLGGVIAAYIPFARSPFRVGSPLAAVIFPVFGPGLVPVAVLGTLTGHTGGPAYHLLVVIAAWSFWVGTYALVLKVVRSIRLHDTWARTWSRVLLGYLVIVGGVYLWVLRAGEAFDSSLLTVVGLLTSPGFILSIMFSGQFHGGFQGSAGDIIVVTGSSVAWSLLTTAVIQLVRRSWSKMARRVEGG